MPFSISIIDIPEDIVYQVLDYVAGAEDQSSGKVGVLLARKDHPSASTKRVGVNMKLIRSLVQGFGCASKRGKQIVTSYLEHHAVIDASFHDLPQCRWFGALCWLGKHRYHLRKVDINLGDRVDVKLFYFLLRSCKTQFLRTLHANTNLNNNTPYLIKDEDQDMTIDEILNGYLNLPHIWGDIEYGLQLTIYAEAPNIEEITIPLRIDGSSSLHIHKALFSKPTLASVTIDLCWANNTIILSPSDFWFICEALGQTPNLRHLVLRSQLDIPTPSQVYACTIKSESLETLDISHLKRGFYLRDCVCPSMRLIIPPKRGSIRMPGNPWHENNTFDALLNETLQDQFLNDLRHI